MTKTMAVSPMPTTPVDALAHLVTRHGWDPRAAEATMVQAHRYAHGGDGRPDLADAGLDHLHTTTSWPVPQSGQQPRSSNLWVWVGGFIALAVIGFLAGAMSPNDAAQVVPGLMIIGFGLAAYFVPTIVGVGRHHHNIGAIAVINVFLGWTLIGWVVALAMAASAVKE